MDTDFQVMVEIVTQTGQQRMEEKLKKMRKEAKLIKSVKDVSGQYYKYQSLVCFGRMNGLYSHLGAMETPHYYNRW